MDCWYLLKGIGVIHLKGGNVMYFNEKATKELPSHFLLLGGVYA